MSYQFDLLQGLPPLPHPSSFLNIPHPSFVRSLKQGPAPSMIRAALNHGSYIHQTYSPRRRISSLMPDDKKHPECASQDYKTTKLCKTQLSQRIKLNF